MAKGKPQKIKLTDILTNEGTQQRFSIDDDHISSCREVWEENGPDNWPFDEKVKLVFDGDHYYLWDGFHRFFATQLAGVTWVYAEVTDGTLDDAIKLSLSANATQKSKPRTNADKRKAVEVALERYPELSDRQIGELCKVVHNTVSKIRKQVGKYPPENDEPIKRRGKDGKEYKIKPVEPKATSENPEKEETAAEDTEPKPLKKYVNGSVVSEQQKEIHLEHIFAEFKKHYGKISGYLAEATAIEIQSVWNEDNYNDDQREITRIMDDLYDMAVKVCQIKEPGIGEQTEQEAGA